MTMLSMDFLFLPFVIIQDFLHEVRWCLTTIQFSTQTRSMQNETITTYIIQDRLTLPSIESTIQCICQVILGMISFSLYKTLSVHQMMRLFSN